MNHRSFLRAALALLLSVCLSLPNVALAADKSGKRHFKEGAKHETLEQWDLAAQQYALAVAAEPNNAEYRLRSSSLSLLQSKGKSRLLASTQIHAADGEQNQTVVGRSVPVRIGATYTGINTGTGNNNNNTTIDNIQYRDVGLVIDVTPVITNDGYVQVKMKLDWLLHS